jgi:hypothetical protein
MAGLSGPASSIQGISMENDEKKIWYLPGPTFQYNEDVNALARENGLRIIDANVTADRTNEEKHPPKVTLKPVAEAAKGGEPTKQDIIDAHARLTQMQTDLDNREKDLDKRESKLDKDRAEFDAKVANDAMHDGSMTVAELKEALKAKGVEFEAGAKKADLQALLDAPAQ